MLSPDCRCQTFDKRANGYVRGEGCGAVVPQRLSQALSSNTPVLAVVHGCVVRHDGRSASLTAPNGSAQQGLLRSTLSHSKCDPSSVSYLEAHGTGTALGDPVEMGAVRGVYGERAQHCPDLVVGAVKSNLGHLETAAGIAGMIKSMLVLSTSMRRPTCTCRH